MFTYIYTNLNMKSKNSYLIIKILFKPILNSMHSSSGFSLTQNLLTTSPIGIKRMRELNREPFYEEMVKWGTENVQHYKSARKCLPWDDYIRDSKWCPFKVINVEGKGTVLCTTNLSILLVIYNNMYKVLFPHLIIILHSYKSAFFRAWSRSFSANFNWLSNNIILSLSWEIWELEPWEFWELGELEAWEF